MGRLRLLNRNLFVFSTRKPLYILVGILRSQRPNPQTLTENRGCERAGSSRGAARHPPRADPARRGVPGSAGTEGGLRPQDPAEEPAEPGPGGLARGAQPLAHGPGAGAARRAPRSAPAPLWPRPRSPRPGAERAGGRPSLSFAPRRARGPGGGVRRLRSWFCGRPWPRAPYTHPASAGKSAFCWTPLDFLRARSLDMHGRPRVGLFLMKQCMLS